MNSTFRYFLSDDKLFFLLPKQNAKQNLKEFEEEIDFY